MELDLSQPTRVTWSFDDLVSSDAHALRCRFSASLRIADTDADRRMFAEIFLGNGRSGVTSEHVIAHFSAALRTAAAGAAQRGEAEALVAGDRAAIQRALIDAAKPVAFACGLEVLPPFHVEMESPTLERKRLESVQRARAEERAAGQVQHLQRATELLKEFQQMREQTPQLSASRLLDQLAPADRGLTLQTLLMASAESSAKRTLYAVAGAQLVRIDPRTAPPELQLIPLPTDVGPLRSVQPAELEGKSMLLVGARGGVIVVDPASPQNAIVLADPSVTSQLGFSRAVARGQDEIWACHGEAGVVGWKREQPESPFARHLVATVDAHAAANASVAVTSPSIVGGSSGARPSRPAGPRNLQRLDSSRLIFSAGGELFVLRDNALQSVESASRAEVMAILPTRGGCVIVHADGTIASLDPGSLRIASAQRRAGGVCAAAALPWMDDVRILLASESGPVDCIGLDDPVVTQYLSTHRGLRVVTASADIVAAVSSDRQRAILWSSWDGRAPIAEIHITAQTRHRVADLDFC